MMVASHECHPRTRLCASFPAYLLVHLHTSNLSSLACPTPLTLQNVGRL